MLANMRAAAALSLSVFIACGGARARDRALPERTPYLMLFERGRSWTLPAAGGAVTCTVAEVKQVGDANVSRLDCGALLVSGTWVATPAGLYHPYLPVDEPDELTLLGDDDLLLGAVAREREHSHALAGGAHDSIEAFGHDGSWCVRQTTEAPAQGERRSWTLCFDGTDLTGGAEDVTSGGVRKATSFGKTPPETGDVDQEPDAESEHATTGFSPADDAAVREVLALQQAAWNRGDLAGYMRGYIESDALVFTSGGKIRRGWQETFDKYKARYGSDPSTMGTLAFEILGVQALGADGAVVLGRWALTNTPVAGRGVFSVALERTRDGWRVVHDHTSSDPP